MTGTITVVGLGPAGADLITAGTLAAIEAHPLPARYLRTARHPSASAVAGATTFDAVYKTAESFDDVYVSIVDALVAAAGDGDVLYAVPGSPRVLERSVDLLVADGRVTTVVVPAMSFLDLAWVRLGIDPLEEGVRLVDGHRFAEGAAGERGPLLVAHCHSTRVLSDIKLAYDIGAPAGAVVLQRLGLPDEAVFDVLWEDLDRAVDPDHLTALYIPSGAPPVAAELERFVELVRRLRADCPWDREQTHASLVPFLVEETEEVVDALGALDPDTGAGFEHLEEELGDLLFQIVFHATIAAEEGAFTLADVARGIHDKLVHRHPHVFGLATAETPEDVARLWAEIKAQDKQT